MLLLLPVMPLPDPLIVTSASLHLWSLMRQLLMMLRSLARLFFLMPLPNPSFELCFPLQLPVLSSWLRIRPLLHMLLVMTPLHLLPVLSSSLQMFPLLRLLMLMPRSKPSPVPSSPSLQPRSLLRPLLVTS